MALTSGVSFKATSAGTGSFVVGSARASFLTPAQAVTLGAMADGFHYSYLAQDNLGFPTQREWGRARFTQATNTFQRTVFGGVDNGVLHQVGSPVNFSTAPIVSLTVLADDLLGGPVGVNTPIVFGAYSPQYYVNGTTGSDDNPGTQALPWKTLQWAANFIAQSNSVVDTVIGIITTVNIADGTYNGFAMTDTGLLGYGAEVVWQGNLADPTKVVITDGLDANGAVTVPVFLSVGCNLVIQSITFKPTAAQNNLSNPFIQFNNFSTITFDSCRFDATATTGMGGIFDLGFSNLGIVSGNTFIDGNIDTLNHPGNYAIFSMQTNLTFGASAGGSNFFLGANYGILKWSSTVVAGTFAGPKGSLQNCTFQNNQGGGPSILPGTGSLVMTPDVHFSDTSVTPSVPYNPDQVTTTVGNLGSTSVIPNVKGLRAVVTDGTAGLAFGATITGGGGNSTQYLVWYNGTNWTVMGK